MNPTTKRRIPIWRMQTPQGQPLDPVVVTQDFCATLSQRLPGLGSTWLDICLWLAHKQPTPSNN